VILALVGPSLPTRVAVWGAAVLSAQAAYRPGQRVEARWRSSPDSPPRETWDAAVMVEPGVDGFHLIRWDSNDTPQRVEAALIRASATSPALPTYRVGDRIQATFTASGSLMTPAVVTEVGQGARIGLYKVQIGPGQEEWRNGYAQITAAAAARMGTTAAGRVAGATARALPAAVPQGRYRCYLVAANTQYMGNVGGGVTEHQMIGYSAGTGVLDVTGATSYRWGPIANNQQRGAFRYDRTSGRITFGVGPYKPDAFRAEFGWNASDGNAVITLYGKSQTDGELKQHCLRQ
jgi:hypothetical protein